MRDGTGHEDDVARAVAEDTVRDVNVAAFGVPGLGLHGGGGCRRTLPHPQSATFEVAGPLRRRAGADDSPFSGVKARVAPIGMPCARTSPASRTYRIREAVPGSGPATSKVALLQQAR